jgi:putative AbiEii toxin of type IV toxin-antitoxin system/AAA domain-containing protein
MDKGAHYFKADLQLHTPRDPNWQLECLTDGEREQFGRDFIGACRTAGLGAVAITDHHDLAFVPWIRAAGQAELDAEGAPVAAERRIVIFPGLELTLAIPCQALLIFSADFPNDRLSAVLDKLGIDPADESQAKANQPIQLGFDTFQELHSRLDETPWLRDQYVILPNVTDGGHQTLMRKHMHGKYRDMPCVGGYLDGPVTEVGTGNRQAFEGLDPNRGYKRIALVQTSDARTLGEVGSNATWIKWAAPTAEALRQACLAQESRISHTEPAVPSVNVTRLRVSNSRFLGPVDLEINPQYSALIGGRGTGKSTCLEYLRWGLCDEKRRLDSGKDDPDVGRRQRLIEQTLKPVEGHVEVHFVLNGIPHFVRRHAGSEELLLKIGSNELQPATEDEVRSLLPIDAYSQRQLSSVGVDLEELQRFVTAPIRERLEDLNARDLELARAIRENFAQVQRQRTIASAVHRDALTADSLAQQVTSMREGLSGLSDDDREILATKPSYDDADGLVRGWMRRADQARTDLEQCRAALAQLTSDLPATGSAGLPEKEVLDDLRREIGELLVAAEKAVASAADSLAAGVDDGSAVASLNDKWSSSYGAFGERYDAAMARSSAHTSKLEELNVLEERRRELQHSLDIQREELKSFGDPGARHLHLRSQWHALQRERTDLLAQQCAHLTRLSEELIRATVHAGAGTDGLQERFKSVVRGSNLRGAKIDAFLEDVAAAPDPLEAWHAALDELEALVIAEGDPAATQGAPVTALKAFAPDELDKIVARVTPETILDLSLLGLDDHPVFEYRTKEGEHIDFADASAGQQATALLRVLLNQGGPPLVIDQPEDDLDNQVIFEIVDLIWKAKAKRQLVFASHNANLVVNGDAELVVCCDYRDAVDHSAGEIKLEGAIDIPAVRDEITVVMEGGEKAFRLRKEKYGF